MKRRILAIVLVLMLAVSLLPAAAMARSVDYVSINGTALEYFGQTVKCGSGTATLTGSESSPRIVLKNAQITKFDNMGTYNGITTYVGIAYYGDAALEISLEGKNTITAPAHASNAVYAAVVSNRMITITGGAIIYDTPKSFLNISGVDIGVEAVGDDGNGRGVEFSNAGFDISASQLCIYSGSMTGSYMKMNLVCSGYAAVISEGGLLVSHNSTANISHSHVLSNPGKMAVGISAEGSVGANMNSKLTVNMNVDARSVENYGIQGIAAKYVQTLESSSIILNLNVKSDKSGETIGIYCDRDLESEGNSPIKARLSFSGEHGYASGIITDNLMYAGDITSTITGAGPEDIALAVKSYIGFQRSTYNDVGMIEFSPPSFGSIYASVDNENTVCGAMVHGFDCTDKYGALKIAYPVKGYFTMMEDGDDSLCIVTDANGDPAATVVMNCEGYSFRDIDGKNDAPYKNAILWAVEQGITNGVSAVEFQPSVFCTRGQIVTFLWRAMGCPEPEDKENPFIDVKESSYYYKPILWAYENGITTGTDDTHFSPEAICTRAQAVTFLWRSEGRPEYEISANPFVDISDKGQCAPYYDAILWAYENGITTGTDDTHFSPYSKCTRAQIVTFIFRDIAE